MSKDAEKNKVDNFTDGRMTGSVFCGSGCAVRQQRSWRTLIKATPPWINYLIRKWDVFAVGCWSSRRCSCSCSSRWLPAGRSTRRMKLNAGGFFQCWRPEHVVLIFNIYQKVSLPDSSGFFRILPELSGFLSFFLFPLKKKKNSSGWFGFKDTAPEGLRIQLDRIQQPNRPNRLDIQHPIIPKWIKFT